VRAQGEGKNGLAVMPLVQNKGRESSSLLFFYYFKAISKEVSKAFEFSLNFGQNHSPK
jgi:hypothetical protein